MNLDIEILNEEFHPDFGEIQVIDKTNEKTSELINDGDGTSPFATKQEVENNINNAKNELEQKINEEVQELSLECDSIDEKIDNETSRAIAVEQSLSNSVNQKANIDDIPSRISELENDAGYVTAEQIDSYSKEEVDSKIAIKVDKVNGKGLSTNDFSNEDKTKLDNINLDVFYNKNEIDSKLCEKADTSDIPTKTSDIENDSGFITTDDVDLSNYYNKDEVDTTIQQVDEKIEEVSDIAKSANFAKGYNDYESLIEELNNAESDKYNIGQSFLIVTLNVPDLWVKSIEETRITYAYNTDQEIIESLQNDGFIQFGYYKLCMLETLKQDLTNYIKKNDYATSSKAGIVQPYASGGLRMDPAIQNLISLNPASGNNIKNRQNTYRAIQIQNADLMIKTALTRNENAPHAGEYDATWTDEDKTKARAFFDTQKTLTAGKNISLDNNKVSFVAEELELIEKRIIGYAVLNTKPSDWEENYTNYYKNSGTAKEPNYELLTEYEAWSNGKFYSFTQSPSGRITFNVETDGTPYDFSQIAVNVLIPQVTDEYGATIYVRAGDDSSIAIYETQISLGTLVASRTSNTNILFVIKKNGNWLTANITNKSPLIYFSNNKNKLCMFQFVRDAVKPFVANSVITVYGIR